MVLFRSLDFNSTFGIVSVGSFSFQTIVVDFIIVMLFGKKLQCFKKARNFVCFKRDYYRFLGIRNRLKTIVSKKVKFKFNFFVLAENVLEIVSLTALLILSLLASAFNQGILHFFKSFHLVVILFRIAFFFLEHCFWWCCFADHCLFGWHCRLCQSQSVFQQIFRAVRLMKMNKHSCPKQQIMPTDETPKSTAFYFSSI